VDPPAAGDEVEGPGSFTEEEGIIRDFLRPPRFLTGVVLVEEGVGGRGIPDDALSVAAIWEGGRAMVTEVVTFEEHKIRNKGM